MAQRDLTETLQELVRRHGIRTVLNSLADIQAEPDQDSSSTSRKRSRNAASKRISSRLRRQNGRFLQKKLRS